LTRPLVEQVKAAIFYDIGSVWSKTADINLGDLRSSVGVGLRVTTPLGPIRFDYGYGLNYEPGDKRGRFHFSMGYVF
jgi:outer membrane protein insertion porin family